MANDAASDNNNTQLASIGQLIVQNLGLIQQAITGTFPNFVTAPANSTASGVAGQVAFSGSASATAYFYVCLTSGATGSATWGRTQLTTSF